MSERTLRNTGLFFVLLIGLGAGVAGAAQKAIHPLAASLPAQPIKSVALYRAADLDRVALAREDDEREIDGLPYRFAHPERVNLSPANSGTWEEPEAGTSLWRLRVHCPDAISLNLGFTRYQLPNDARLALHAVGGTDPVLVFDAQDNKAHGQLWTPVIEGDELVVELLLPTASRKEVDLNLGSIGCGYRGFLDDDPLKSQFCEVDVICPEGDLWREEIVAVAVYTVNGTWKCTGTMMANTAQDDRPLFLTANHCGVGSTNSSQVVIYWNYQSPTCGQQGGGSLAETQSGTTWLASYAPTDFTLLELDDLPEATVGATYAGWDRDPSDPSSAVCIHHPSTDEKAISFENDPVTTTSWAREASPGDGTHIMVRDWDVGSTEGGSSGSALFNPEHRVVGQLHGGWASCDNDSNDWYGRLSRSWDGGGTPTTRLSDHLDPLNTGVTVFPPIFPLSISGFGDWTPSGPAGGPFTPEQDEIQVRNFRAEDLVLSVTATVDWIDVPAAELQVPSMQETSFVLAFNDLANDLEPGDHPFSIDLEETTTSESRSFDLVLRVGGVADLQILGAGPNPFTSFVQIDYSLGTAADVQARIWDLRGRLVRDFGTQRGVRGPNELVWDGLTDSGRRVAAGVYFCQLEAAGKEARIRILSIH